MHSGWLLWVLAAKFTYLFTQRVVVSLCSPLNNSWRTTSTPEYLCVCVCGCVLLQSLYVLYLPAHQFEDTAFKYKFILSEELIWLNGVGFFPGESQANLYRISTEQYLALRLRYLMKHFRRSFWYLSLLKGWSFACHPQRNHWHSLLKIRHLKWCPLYIFMLFKDQFTEKLIESAEVQCALSPPLFLNPYLQFPNPRLNG